MSRNKQKLRQQRRKLDSAKFAEQDIVLASATVAPAVLTDDEPFEIEAYTGGPLDLPNFDHPLYVDCDTAVVQGGDGAQAPLLMEHDGRRPVGHGYPRISDTEIRVHDSRLSFDNADTRDIRAAAEKEFSWQVSIGAKLTRPAEFIRAGQTKHVNGRVARGPCFIARGVVVRETSFCSLGRDLGRATAHIAASEAGGNDEMDMTFEEWCDSIGIDKDAMTDEGKAKLMKAYEAAYPAEPDKPVEAAEPMPDGQTTVTASAAQVAAETQKAAREAHLAETKRLAAIDKINASYSSVAEGDRQPLYEQAIEGSLSANDFELGLLKKSRSTPTASGVASAGSRRGRTNNLALEAALLQNYGMSHDDIQASMSREHESKAVEDAIDMATSMRDAKWSDIIYACIDGAGVTPSSRRFSEDVLREAWKIEASASSTVSLKSILQGTVNRHLLTAYSEQAKIVEMICGQIDTPDLKQNELARDTLGGELEEVGSDGEVTSVSIGEELTRFRATTKARLLHLSEDHQINDDLNAFLQAARKFARMGAQSLTRAIVEAITKAPTAVGPGTKNTFFRTESFRNYKPNALRLGEDVPLGTVGLSGSLSLDGLKAATTLLRKQKDANGIPVQMEPNHLLVTADNSVDADTLYTSTNIVAGGGLVDTVPEANPFKGKYMPCVSPHLGDLSYNPAGSNAEKVARQWYLISKQGDDIAPVIVAWLIGQGRQPRVKTFEVANRIGQTMQAVMRFGVAAHDQRTIVKVFEP